VFWSAFSALAIALFYVETITYGAARIEFTWPTLMWVLREVMRRFLRSTSDDTSLTVDTTNKKALGRSQGLLRFQMSLDKLGTTARKPSPPTKSQPDHRECRGAGHWRQRLLSLRLEVGHCVVQHVLEPRNYRRSVAGVVYLHRATGHLWPVPKGSLGNECIMPPLAAAHARPSPRTTGWRAGTLGVPLKSPGYLTEATDSCFSSR